MKNKITLLAAAATILSTAAFAQEMSGPPSRPTGPGMYGNYVNRIRFGAFVAPNISWMHPTANKSDDGQYNVTSDGSKVGFTYGLMAEYFFAPNYGIVTGIDINSTGGKIIATAVDQTPSANKVSLANFDYRLQFIEIPIALKLKTDDFSGFRFFGQLGLSAGINIGKKVDYTVDYYDENGNAMPAATGQQNQADRRPGRHRSRNAANEHWRGR